MTTLTETLTVDASRESVWRAIEDLDQRRQWDVAVRSVVHEPPGPVHVGTEMTQVTRWVSGGARVRVRYTEHDPPRAATVVLVRGPWFFRQLTASFELSPVGEDGARTRVEARYELAWWPGWLAWAIGPVAGWVFARETRARWRSLARFVRDRGAPVTPA